jgi:uncharacterized protein
VNDGRPGLETAPSAETGLDGGTGSFVTIDIHRRVKPGRESEYEAVLSGVLADAVAVAGARSATTLALGGSPTEYQVLLHFDSEAALRSWTGSEARRRWLERMEELSDGPATFEVLNAQEAWLVEPQVSPAAPPPRYKVAVLTWVGIFPVITTLLAVLRPSLKGLPLVGQTFVLTACAIPLMTWVVMPALNRFSRSWLHA